MSTESANQKRGNAYRELWGKINLKTVSKSEREKRNTKAREIADAYYTFINDNFEGGWNRKFHFGRFQPGDSINAALSRQEHFMALMTHMKPGFKVLDVGCGNGAPARSIAAFILGHVTGITINKPQIARARQYTEEEGLSECVDFVEGDFTKMPFADNTFDAAHAFEATCYAPTLESVYSEVARVLKPGAYWGTYEWMMTPLYDDKNPIHNEIRSRIEFSMGVVNITNRTNAIESIKKAGLEFVTDMDVGIPNYRNPVPWWYPLDGDLHYVSTWSDWTTVFFLKKWVYLIVSSIYWFLELFGILAKGRTTAIQTVAMGVYAMRNGARLGIFTPIHLFIARKPPCGEECLNF